MESQSVDVHMLIPCHVALLPMWVGDFSAASYPVQDVYTTASLGITMCSDILSVDNFLF